MVEDFSAWVEVIAWNDSMLCVNDIANSGRELKPSLLSSPAPSASPAKAAVSSAYMPFIVAGVLYILAWIWVGYEIARAPRREDFED
jgi:hypothetical protein